jgi:hypothetical protein
MNVKLVNSGGLLYGKTDIFAWGGEAAAALQINKRGI